MDSAGTYRGWSAGASCSLSRRDRLSRFERRASCVDGCRDSDEGGIGRRSLVGRVCPQSRYGRCEVIEGGHGYFAATVGTTGLTFDRASSEARKGRTMAMMLVTPSA